MGPHVQVRDARGPQPIAGLAKVIEDAAGSNPSIGLDSELIDIDQVEHEIFTKWSLAMSCDILWTEPDSR